MDYSSCTQEGGGGKAAPVGACAVGVCGEGGERHYEEVFLWQRCQIELRSLFDGAMGSHETDCLGMSVRV